MRRAHWQSVQDVDGLCTYLNRGVSVPVVTVDEPGHLHVAWANSEALTTCTGGGNVVALTFEFDGCFDPSGCIKLNLASLLDNENSIDLLDVTSSVATILGGTSSCDNANALMVSTVAPQTVATGQVLSVQPTISQQQDQNRSYDGAADATSANQIGHQTFTRNVNVTWSVENSPPGATIGPSSGLFQWTPQPGQEGLYEGVSLLAQSAGTAVGVAFDISSIPAVRKKTYVSNRVVVNFAAGSIACPATATGGSLAEMNVRDPSLRSLLTSVGATRLERIAPAFTPTSLRATDVNGDSIQLPCDLSNLYAVSLADTNVQQCLIALSADSASVVFAEPDYLCRLDFVPNDPLYPQQAWLHSVGSNDCPLVSVAGSQPSADVSAAWGTYRPDPYNYNQIHTSVGVIDTGVDLEHPDFARIVDGGNLVGGVGAQDYDGHGTEVAGIIAAFTDNGTGVAGIDASAAIVAYKVENGTGSETSSVLATAYDSCRRDQLRITNLSSHAVDGPSSALAMALKNAHATGMLNVTGMGNDNASQKNYPAGYTYFTEAVGGIFPANTRWNDNTLNQSECWPANEAQGSDWGSWIDIAAPSGHGMVTTDLVSRDGYVQNPQCRCSTNADGTSSGFGGTSAAAAVLSGAAALVYEAARNLHPLASPLSGEDLAQILQRTATDIGPSGFDNDTGAGGVSVASAVSMVRSTQSIVFAKDQIASQFASTSVPGGIRFQNNPDFSGVYPAADRIEYRATVTFPASFADTPAAWGTMFNSVGTSADNTLDYYQEPVGWAEVVPGSITLSGCTLRTYVDRLYTLGGALYGYWPHGTTRLDLPIVKLFGTVIGAASGVAGVADASSTPGPDPFSLRAGKHGQSVAPWLTVSRAMPVALEVFDVSGRRVWQQGGPRSPGVQEIAIGSPDRPLGLNSGIYVCRASSGSVAQTIRFVYAK